MLADDVILQRSEQGNCCLFDRRDKFVACKKDGNWVTTPLFEDSELEEFYLIEDEQEILRVLEEARAALSGT
jgi:hypothetical protein